MLALCIFGRVYTHFSGKKVERELGIVDEEWEQSSLHCNKATRQAAEEEISKYSKFEAKPNED